MHRAVVLLGYICLIFLSGCAGTSWQDDIKAVQPATLAQRGKAAIIISSSIRVPNIVFTPREIPVSLGWYPSGSKQNGRVWTNMKQTADHPSIVEVDPGTYELDNLNFWHGADHVFSESWTKNMAHVSVAAGEVIYLGHVQLVVDGVLRRHSRFTLTVVNNQDKARATLATVKPELAAKMVTRLITPNPVVVLGLRGG
jgi:hypothetical protein